MDPAYVLSAINGDGINEGEPWRATASAILGWASLCCWLIVGFPQFIELYRVKTGEAMSLSFLIIWGVGDVLNIIGCVLAQQLLTQLAVAIWYTVMDGFLIGQIYYYDVLNPHLKDTVKPYPDSETQYLDPSGQSLGKGRRKSSFAELPTNEKIRSSFETAPRGYMNQSIARRASSIFRSSSTTAHLTALPLLVVPALILSIGYLSHDSSYAPNNLGAAPYPGGVTRALFSGGGGACTAGPTECWWGSVLGWISSILYIVSRMPQLWKNFVRKSCEGLSIWMFFFGVLGNVTYAGSIFILSTDPDYLMTSLPFIIGSLGTLGFDLAIFIQFFIYAEEGSEKGYEPIQ